MSEKPSLRLVPGAPEPELSKSQQKRRRGKGKATGGTASGAPASPATPAIAVPDAAAAAQLETAPNANAVAPELAAEPTTPGATSAPLVGGERKSSVWEMVNRRYKALQKKIVRQSDLHEIMRV
jgi:hypothetical protein